MRNSIKNFMALILGLILALGAAEIILRVFDPFQFRVKHDEIILPANKVYSINNVSYPELDSSIIHTKNSLGFRGKEMPDHFDRYFSIIAVGGSTTECFSLSDGKEWVSRLGNKLNGDFTNIWINNAGLNGHSTFGHHILLRSYLSKIKPDMILYLVGCNDAGRDDLTDFDRHSIRSQYTSWGNWLTKNSEVISVIVNLKRGLKAQERQLICDGCSLKNLSHVSSIDTVALVATVRSQQQYLSSYRKRLTNLIQDTKKFGIEPVLITQPSLIGKGIDEITKVNLETVKVMDERGGKFYWTILEQYNNVTRQVAEEHNVLLIDLAHALPKSSLYFYDPIHYTNEGAEKISDIIYPILKNHLKEKTDVAKY